MMDVPNTPGGERRLEAVPTRRVGAFEFMADHLFDLVVIIIRDSDDGSDVIRRVELYYAENHRVSCFAFDRSSKQFKSDTQRALQAALAQFYKEVKSRTLSHQAFVVWYFTEADRKLMEMHAADYADEHKALLKYYEILKKNAQIIPEPPPEDEESEQFSG